MKKIVKFLCAALAVLGVTIAVTSCNPDSDDTSAKSGSKLEALTSLSDIEWQTGVYDFEEISEADSSDDYEGAMEHSVDIGTITIKGTDLQSSEVTVTKLYTRYITYCVFEDEDKYKVVKNQNKDNDGYSFDDAKLTQIFTKDVSYENKGTFKDFTDYFELYDCTARQSKNKKIIELTSPLPGSGFTLTLTKK